MSIREDVVASAAKFLQDPGVATSPLESRIAFLTAKNLSQDEVQAALARAASGSAMGPQSVQHGSSPAGPVRPYASAQYPPQYPPQYPSWAWQQQHQQPLPPPPPPPRRDWRDYFIVATVVGGVSYGLYELGKRYVYPLIAPPTPDRLEADKKSMDEQWERTFALVDQLSKDTEALKAAEQERTERLDSTIGNLERVMDDLKAANYRREEDARRMRDEVLGIKEALPKALENQKSITDGRLVEVNAELKSLKTLITQRMNPAATSTSINSYLHQTPGFSPTAVGSSGTGGPAAGNLYGAKPSGLGSAAPPAPGGISNMINNGGSSLPPTDNKAKVGVDEPVGAVRKVGVDEPSGGITMGIQKRHTIAMTSGGERKSPFSSSLTQPMSIPAWQIAPKSSASTAAPDAGAGTTEVGSVTS